MSTLADQGSAVVKPLTPQPSDQGGIVDFVCKKPPNNWLSIQGITYITFAILMIISWIYGKYNLMQVGIFSGFIFITYININYIICNANRLQWINAICCIISLICTIGTQMYMSYNIFQGVDQVNEMARDQAR